MSEEIEKWLDMMLPTMKRDDPLRPKLAIFGKEVTPYPYELFNPQRPEGQCAILMEHIASGAPNRWCVYWDGGSYPTDSFEDANQKYDSLDKGKHVSLVLYTRIGTSVAFRYKE